MSTEKYTPERTEYSDWEAVAALTGCGKLHGAQGPAPTIAEMVEAFQRDADGQLREASCDDMIGSSPSSLIATLLARCRELRSMDDDDGAAISAERYGNTYPWCDVRRDHYVIELEHEPGKMIRFLNLDGDIRDRKLAVAARLRATADEMERDCAADTERLKAAAIAMRDPGLVSYARSLEEESPRRITPPRQKGLSR